MTETRTDDGLDAFFDAARARGAAPSEALLARIRADAEAHRPAPARRASGGGFASLAGPILRALGGWPSAAGLATAAAAGVWVGFAAPDAVDSYIGLSQGAQYDILDLLPGYGDAALVGG